MSFHVGQKVVCIGSNEQVILSDEVNAAHNRPDLRAIYTIREIFYWGSKTLLRLREIDNRHLMPLMRVSVEPGYCATGFRPLVEKKADTFFTEGAPLDSDRWDNRKPAKVLT